MSAQPTDAERAEAAKIRAAFFDAIKAHRGPTPRDVIAQALADQRARYEAVAADLVKHTVEPENDAQRGFIRGLNAAALYIRQVSA